MTQLNELFVLVVVVVCLFVVFFFDRKLKADKQKKQIK